MPKGKVSEEELSKSIKSIGSFGSITGKERPKRDSPFGAPAPEAPAVEAAPKSSDKVVEMPQVETKSSEQPQVVPPTPTPTPQQPTAGARVIREHTPQNISEAASQVRVLSAEAASEPQVRKADIYPERVTVQMSTEMRDAIDVFAKELQRRRTDKSERITANTVMRVAISSFLKNFQLAEGEVINTEEELLAFVEQITAERK